MDKIHCPQSYWHRRGKSYRGGRYSNKLLKNLSSLFKSLKARQILEVGSGWGKIYSVWRNLKLNGSYTMCDFVKSMLDGCQRATGIRPDKWDGERLPYSDDAFDLVVSFSVLLHVPPTDIEAMLAEHVRVCSRWLFVASLSNHSGRLASHCFVHNYEPMFMKLGLAVVKKRDFGDQTCWLLRKGGDG